MNDFSDLLTRLSRFNMFVANAIALRIMQAIDKVARPPTPTYIPLHPMTEEEQERVKRHDD